MRLHEVIMLQRKEAGVNQHSANLEFYHIWIRRILLWLCYLNLKLLDVRSLHFDRILVDWRFLGFRPLVRVVVRRGRQGRVCQWFRWSLLWVWVCCDLCRIAKGQQQQCRVGKLFDWFGFRTLRL